MTGIDDEDLRARFEALREYDRETQPDFVIERSRESTRAVEASPFAKSLRWAVAAAAVVILGSIVIGKTRDQNTTHRIVTPSITEWQSPTARLLETPATSVLAPRPLLSSVFDGVTTSLQLKTD